MIGEVLQPRLHAPIIFAGDEDEAVGIADLSRQLLQNGRRLALPVFLVHAVENRQADLFGVDQLDIIAPRAESLDNEMREANPHAIGTIGAVENENAIAHGNQL